MTRRKRLTKPTPRKRPATRAAPARTESVVITGASSFLGSSILRILERQSANRRLIAVDREGPAFPLTRAAFYRIDLATPSAERRLRHLLEGCGHRTTVVHTALPGEPTHRERAAHRLMIAGSLALLRAAKAANARKLVLASTTDVYGALATNPQYLAEEAQLRGGSQSPDLEARIHVEELFQKYGRTGRDRIVTILRPCSILGSTIKNFKTTFLQQPVIPTILGFDPLVQFVHESDVLRAFIMVIERDAPGIYNIVGEGVMPLSRAIRIAGRPSVPLPQSLLSLVTDIAWNLGMGLSPSLHLPFLKYPCVADGEKARRELGFVPVYTSQEALLSFAGSKTASSRPW